MDNPKPNTAVISLGSNIEDAENSVKKAIAWLAESFENTSASPVYMTEPVGSAVGSYCNAVVRLETRVSEAELDVILKRYEILAGRTEESRKLKRVPIDLDIVVFNGSVTRPWEYSQMFFRTGFESL